MMFWTNSATKRLRRMLEAIRARDFTLQYSLEHLSGEERLLAEEVNAVIREFRDIQARQEAMYGQYETLLNLVDASLLVDDSHGKIIWMNQKAIRNLCGFRIEQLDMLAAVHPDLPAALRSLESGQKRLLHLHVGDHDVDWNISMTRYFRKGDEARLFSIENIQTVVQQNEVESQKRLVSVLTHEIMNSLSPIISLSDTLVEGWKNRDIDYDDAGQALAVINRRSEGLLRFVENYRQLSRLSPPKREPVTIGSLIGDLQSLFSDSNIEYSIANPSDFISIDRNQMEQVLINLLKNAQEATAGQAETPRIQLSTYAIRSRQLLVISVTDNGCGIRPDVAERIFVPFFTTKPGGSGIGLSLCKQIVSMHGGIIGVNSHPGETTFTIQLSLHQ